MGVKKEWDVTDHASIGITLYVFLVGKEYSRMLNNLPRITQVERDPNLLGSKIRSFHSTKQST